MTIAPPESSGPAGASPGDGETAGDPEAPTIRPVVRQRAARRRRQRRRVLAAQGVTTAFFVVGLVALVWLGWSAALRITGGGNPTEVSEPDEPGGDKWQLSGFADAATAEYRRVRNFDRNNDAHD